MKILNNFRVFALLISTLQLYQSCTGNASFTDQEMRFTNPFKENTVVVYKSAKGQMDTVRFLRVKMDTAKFRSFEQGYYNENFVIVDYELTNNSYHKISIPSVDKKTENLLLFRKTKGSEGSKEFGFLGLLFDEDYLKRILNTKDSVIIFDRNDARYTGLNINEQIKRFKFDFNRGIVSFTDIHDIEWIRVN